MKAKVIYKALKEEVILPKNFNNDDIKLFSNIIDSKNRDLKAFYYKNIFINEDLILWNNFSFLRESFLYKKVKISKWNKFKFLLKSKFRNKRTIKNGIWIIDTWSHVYYHWLFDVIQKSLMIKNNHKIIIPRSFLIHDFILETIKIFQLKLEIIEPDTILKVNNLISIPTVNFSGMFFKEKLIDIKSRILQFSLTNSLKNKVYISRKYAVRRKIINENELIGVLKKHGFKIYYLENLSWKKQINIFANAGTLLSIHGSGLSNMIFLNEKSNVLEIRHPKSFNQNSFFLLASILNINYYYILGDPKDDDPHQSDLKTNILELEQILKKIDYE